MEIRNSKNIANSVEDVIASGIENGGSNRVANRVAAFICI